MEATEDLRERCYRFGLSTIKFTDGFVRSNASRVIADQLIRSGTSIGANVIEAKGASSRLDFKKFYEIALKSAHETRYWLRLAKDAGVASEIRADELSAEVEQLLKMLSASVLKLKQRP